MTVEASSRLQIVVWAYPVRTSVKLMLDYFPTLTVCRATGNELISAIDEIQKWLTDTKPEEVSQLNISVDMKFQRIMAKAKEFETVLSAELQTLATYHASQKGIYSTTDLIERAEKIFPQSVLAKTDSGVIEEIRQSGRCLAFDNATASAFHMMRATEAVMHKYYIYACSPSSEEKLGNWGAYITELQKSQKPEVKEVVAMLQQIKDRHRNLIMHPEVVLTPDEAFTLFEIAQGAIIAMADKLPVAKK